MADHPTNSEEQQTDGALPNGETAAASTDDKTVPLAELVKQRQRASDAERQLAEIKAQLAGERQAPETDPKPPQSTESNPFEARLKAIERRDSLNLLMSEQGLDAKQADAVQAIMDEMSGLNSTEARQIAALRDPDTFAESASRTGYDPGMHGSSRPMPGSVPDASNESSDYEDRLEHAASLLKSGNKKAHARFVDNMVGRIAARQVGRSGHKMLPLPRKS